LYQAETDFQQQENPSIINPTRDVLILQVPRILTRRKVYLWLYQPSAGAGDYDISGDISFYLTGQKIGSIPVSVCISNNAGGSCVAATRAMLCTTGGATENSIIIYPANGTVITGVPTSVTLQPISIRATCDEMRLSLNVMLPAGIHVRAWFGCLSNGKSKQQNIS
jgi:hypothetical protein